MAGDDQASDDALDDSQTELDGGDLLRKVVRETAQEQEEQAAEAVGSDGVEPDEQEFVESRPERILSIVNGSVQAQAYVSSELVQGVDTTEPELRFQRHTTEDGVGICLTLVLPTGESGSPRLVIWPIEGTPENTLVLNQLAEQFVVDVSVTTLDDDEEPIELRLSPPLEANVARILDGGFGDVTEAAFERIAAPEYELLGTMAHSFSEDSFSQLLTAAEARLAVGIVNYWNSTEQRDYLLDIQSFPGTWWDAIVRRVVEAAFQFGLVVQGSLRTEMRRIGRAETDAELLGVLIAHFAEVNLNLRPNELIRSTSGRIGTSFLMGEPNRL